MKKLGDMTLMELGAYICNTLNEKIKQHFISCSFENLK